MRWRCIDVRAEVERRFSVTVDEGTIGKWLNKLRLTRLQPRPYHPKKDLAAQEAFKKLQFYSEGSTSRLYCRNTRRDMVSRRSQGRAERLAQLCLGARWFASADGAG